MLKSGKILVTGGAGFIGRWVVKGLLAEGAEVAVVDNFSNSHPVNLAEFSSEMGLTLHHQDIREKEFMEKLFSLQRFAVCIHLAASINVQDSIDNPRETFDNDALATLLMLELCRQHRAYFVFVSTCLVYDRYDGSDIIDEHHPVKPHSPYSASKLAGEFLTMSYHYTYGLPVTVLRPFNTYGPFQKSTGEGGVVATFLRQRLSGKPLLVYGDGEQTRDLLYVKDCARFIISAAFSEKAVGRVINAATNRETRINDLAAIISGGKVEIDHVPHIHPQSEVGRMRGSFALAQELLGWEPRVHLDVGIMKTKEHIAQELGLDGSER
jgi:UDP-glucose 4-epimerase